MFWVFWERGVSEGGGYSVELSNSVRLGKCGRMGSKHPIYCPPTLRAASAKFLCNASGRGILLTDNIPDESVLRRHKLIAQHCPKPHVLFIIHILRGQGVKTWAYRHM